MNSHFTDSSVNCGPMWKSSTRLKYHFTEEICKAAEEFCKAEEQFACSIETTSEFVLDTARLA